MEKTVELTMCGYRWNLFKAFSHKGYILHWLQVQ